MNKLPNVNRGTQSIVGSDKSNELFVIPADALPPAGFNCRNVSLVGNLFVKVGVDGQNDTVSPTDYHYVFLPGDEKMLDNPGSGSILVISDQAAGVAFAWSVRYTTAGNAPGANTA